MTTTDSPVPALGGGRDNGPDAFSQSSGLLAFLSRRSWLGAFVITLALWALGVVASGNFSFSFLANNATIAAFLALAGVAQMIVIASGPGNFDLSLPYIVTYSAYVMSAGFFGYDDIWASLALSLIVGVASGLLNAFLVTKLRIPTIVATLATGYILYSLTLKAQSLGTGTTAGDFQDVLRTRYLGFPSVFYLIIIVLIAMSVLLAFTVYGRKLHAMGQNREAARLAGVRLDRMTFATFALSGLISAVLGILLSTFQGGVSADLGNTYLLGSVAAVVVGGTSIAGGITSVIGTAIRALLVTLALTDLDILRVDPSIKAIVQGLIVIVTVCISGIRRP
ncbi:ABC transporter permease (plasmid) [Mesorhizobium sp. ORM8.1]